MLAIVTDSTAYLTAREAHILGVRVVPIAYTAGGQTYLEGCGDRNGDFSRLLAYGASTAQASVEAFVSTFEELLRRGFDVLCITVSSRLSGTYSSASRAARELASSRVEVVDSLTTGAGLYYLIKRARALADHEYTLAQTAIMVEDLRTTGGTAFSVESMDALRRSGRLGIVRQSVGTVLNLRPILRLKDGAIVSQGLARGRTERRRVLLEQIPAGAKEIAIQSVGESTEVAQLVETVQAAFPQAPVTARLAGPVLGIHLGRDALGVAWFGA